MINEPTINDDIEIPTGLCNALELLTGSAESSSGGSTLKTEGSIASILVIILVDSGATHNFVSRKLVTALGLATSFFSDINIQLDDGWV